MRRLMGIMLALVLLGAALSAPAPHRNEERDQREAITAILKLGGKILYDYQREDPKRPNVFDPKAMPKDPQAFHRVVLVNLEDTLATDADLTLLRKLPSLENLNLTNTRITSAGLIHLRGLKRLAVLSLWKTQVDDAGLEHLKDLTSLWQLILDETNVTDAGMIHLKRLTNLQPWLGLANTQVSDEGLKYLTGLTKLRSLNLRFTKVTVRGVKQLRLSLPTTDISVGR